LLDVDGDWGFADQWGRQGRSSGATLGMFKSILRTALRIMSSIIPFPPASD
jgi:hypothetical protein